MAFHNLQADLAFRYIKMYIWIRHTFWESFMFVSLDRGRQLRQLKSRDVPQFADTSGIEYQNYIIE